MTTAKVAKLVDAPGLGPDALTGVRVRVPPFAPFLQPPGLVDVLSPDLIELVNNLCNPWLKR